MRRREREPASGNFEFTQNETLFSQLHHDRFLALLKAPETTILQATLSTNLYGEFLFITLRYAPGHQPAQVLTFYGLGYHDQRERWITESWSWYPAHERETGAPLAKAEVQRLIAERQTEIGSSIGERRQSKRAQFFEMLADLTDEDGALAEMEDLEALGFDFDEEDDDLR
jgi:hypothetical protein